MSGFDISDYGWRGLENATMRFNTQDRFAEKYYSVSPYQYAANNPIFYIDVNGDSLNLAKIQRGDIFNKTSNTTAITNDLQAQTGLSYTISSDGNLSYAKNKDGNPIIGKITSASGNSVLQGSATARDLMIKVINANGVIDVGFGKTTGAVKGTDVIGFNPQQIEGFINGTYNMDNRTLGWGMTLIHEITHTNIGGGLSDIPYNPAPTVDFMNNIRGELNAQGGNYGQRLEYFGSRINSSVYLPFNHNSKVLVGAGLVPFGANNQFLKF